MSPRSPVALLAALLLAAGCAPTYAYTFQLKEAAPSPSPDVLPVNVFEDADIKAALIADPRTLDSINLAVTNKTDQVLQVRWAEVTVSYPGGGHGLLRPDTDLGWIQPNTTQSAYLVPFVLPDRGTPAAAYEGRVFELRVPMIIRRESKSYSFHLTSHVRKIQ